MASRKKTALLAFLPLAAILLLPPFINLGRFQHRIAGSISRSVGRPVSMDAVSFRLLPWPALKIENLAIAEDPGFGAEPALRAPEVVAEPRLLSLWRGRFELAKVELTDASVNLVRNGEGRWSIASVLLQASRVPNAPTAGPRSGGALRFPYIEATGTRINIKQGVEKLPYSLLNADFTMYLARPEVWHLKLEGAPTRTDLPLFSNDIGVLRLEGDLHRASVFGSMPLNMRGEWSGGAMGQLSQMLLARDIRWRGEVGAVARFTGDLDHLTVRTHVSVAGLHRQEFTPERPIAVEADCRGLYSRAEPAADNLRCDWPLGAGGLAVVHGAAGTPWMIEANRVGADVLASAVGLLRPGLPPARIFSGELTGVYTWNPKTQLWSGQATMPALRTDPITLLHVRLTALGKKLAITADPVRSSPRALQLGAELTRHGYLLHLTGGGAFQSLDAAARALRVPSFSGLSALSGDSTVDLNLQAAGTWVSAAAATGTVRLANVRWQPSWLPFPIDLRSAAAALSPGLVQWTVADATAGILQLSGSAQVPLGCTVSPCLTNFALQTPALDAAALETALTRGRPELLNSLLARLNGAGAGLPALAGTVHAGVLTLGRLPVRDAMVSMAAGPGFSVEFRSLDGRALGGSLHLQGTLSLASGTPEYRLHASLTGASAAEAAELWQESWGPGTLGGTAELALSGGSTPALLRSAGGSFAASWQHGALGPLRFNSWDGSGTITGDGLQIERSTLSGNGAGITGSIGWDRSLQLALTPGAGQVPVPVTGTLAEPVSDSPAAPER